MPRGRKSEGPALDAYRRKRSPGATPEPFGGGAERPGMFVVQQHAARRLHYDFRLEIDGVLRSWAVPRGPSLDPADKRLAVETEDHPIEYGDFEGIIPAGNYGAGAVVVWDRGLAVHELDPAAGMEDGKLLFELKGFKLRGLWTLVRTTRGPKEWLLIKKPDAAATGETVEEMRPESVFSGLTVEELAGGHDRAGELRAELERLGARRRRVDPARVKLMLARLEPTPFSRPSWLFEIKYDGYRVLAATEEAAGSAAARGRARLLYRSGLDATAIFPEVARALTCLPYRSLVLDGEMSVVDEAAAPSFQLLQQRARLRRHRDIERAALQLPATLFAFDLLGFEDFDLRGLPLAERKRLLARVLPGAGPVRFADHVEERGEELFAAVRARGLEGLLAKKADSVYRGGRSGNWLKLRSDRVGDFVVVGFTRPKSSRTGFGALHLAHYDDDRLVYAGRVGSGFNDRQLGEIRELLEAERRRKPPFEPPVPAGKEHLWVEPRQVVEVKFTQYTDAGHLRHPVFLRLRDDKPPADCVREDRPPDPAEPEPPRRRPELQITRPEKVFWPEDGATKGDLIEYYRAISPWLLPYLEDRPLVLDRYPDGIGGKSFFQKHAPDFTPDWVRTESIFSDDGKETRYYICNDEQTLLYLANLGSIPLHVWASRVGSLEAPDWCILDLDAKQAAFADAVRVAKAARRLCSEIGLECHVKTSGATGLHVLLPLGGQCTHQQSKSLAQVLARIIAQQLPEIASVARSPTAREGKIYLDALQNGYGKLLVAPYSVRPLPGGPVSMPLRWRELTLKLDPKKFTMSSAPRRLARMKKDPVVAALAAKPNLTGALERLAARL